MMIKNDAVAQLGQGAAVQSGIIPAMLVSTWIRASPPTYNEGYSVAGPLYHICPLAGNHLSMNPALKWPGYITSSPLLTVR
jgi:hypothetical protein